MNPWDIKRPRPTTLLDHDVQTIGDYLKGHRIALLVCGGIAAMKAPLIARALRRYSADVTAFVTSEALNYTTKEALEWACVNPVIQRLSAASEHLSKGQPFDTFLLAPATYNTINKFCLGIADNAVTTTLATALGSMEQESAKIIVVPTMHGDFHNSILQQNLETLRSKGVDLCPPRDAFGKHNLPNPENIAAFVSHVTSRSGLRGKKILVTAGPTPVPIDGVRGITNRFKGRLGVEIANQLHLKGAEVRLILGGGVISPPDYINCRVARDFSSYRDMTLETLAEWPAELGIFSAAVADYRPAQIYKGKIASGTLKSIELEATEKVIDLVQERFPKTKMISFKYEENIEHSALVKKGLERVLRGHLGVVVNRGEDVGPNGEQVAYLVQKKGEPVRWTGKSVIAQKLSEFIESVL